MIEIDNVLKYLKVWLQKIDAGVDFLLLQYGYCQDYVEFILSLSNPYYLISAFFLLLSIFFYIYFYKTVYIRKWLEYTPGLVVKKENEDLVVVSSSRCFASIFSGKVISKIFSGIAENEIISGDLDSRFVTCKSREDQRIIAGYITTRKIVFFGRRYFLSFTALTIEDFNQLFGFDNQCSYLLIQQHGLVLSGSEDLLGIFRNDPDSVLSMLLQADADLGKSEKNGTCLEYDRKNGWLWMYPDKLEVGAEKLFLLQAVKVVDLQQAIDKLPFPLEVPSLKDSLINNFQKRIATDFKLEASADYRPLGIDWYDLQFPVKCRIGQLTCENRFTLQARMLSALLEKILLDLNTYRADPVALARSFMGALKVLNPVSLSMKIDGEVDSKSGEPINDEVNVQTCFDYQFKAGKAGLELFLRLDYELTEILSLFINFSLELINRLMTGSENAEKSKFLPVPVFKNDETLIDNEIYHGILTRMSNELQDVLSKAAVSYYGRDAGTLPVIELKEYLALNRLLSYWDIISVVDESHDRDSLNLLELLCDKISEELPGQIGSGKRLSINQLPDDYPAKFIVLFSSKILDAFVAILVRQIFDSARPQSEITVTYSDEARLIYIKAGVSVNKIENIINDELELLMFQKITKLLNFGIEANGDTITISIYN